MKCSVCGAELREGLAFCTACGSRVETQESQAAWEEQPVPPTQASYDIDPNAAYPYDSADPSTTYPYYPADPNAGYPVYAGAGAPAAVRKKKLPVWLIAVLAAVLVAAVTIGVLFATGVFGSDDASEDEESVSISTAEGTVNAFVSAFKNRKYSSVTRLLSQVHLGDPDVEEIEEEVGELLDRLHLAFEDELGTKYTITHEILKEKDIGKRTMEDRLEYYDVRGVSIEAMKEVTVKLTAKHGKSKESLKLVIILTKEKDGWKIFDLDPDI